MCLLSNNKEQKLECIVFLLKTLAELPYFPCCYKERLSQKQLKEGTGRLAHSSRDSLLLQRTPLQQEFEEAGHVTPVVKNQSDKGWYLLSFSL